MTPHRPDARLAAAVPRHAALVRQGRNEGDAAREGQLAQVMDRLLSRQVDAADIYFQYSRLESFTSKAKL